LLQDEVVAVEINPYWNVPPSIAAEVIAEASGDLDAFLAKGYEVLDGWEEDAEAVDPRAVDWTRLAAEEDPALRFRQAPGPTNALGSVKFLLPNRHNIYLHDTPAQASFAGSDRALSHGCIRVAAPLDLATWVLAGQDGWDRTRLAAAMASGEPTGIRLEQDLPVYLLYWTAWMAADGSAQFRDDIYGLDAALAPAPTPAGGRRTAR
jgi:murein L,D-transpeptidase YcbB/YkuD